MPQAQLSAVICCLLVSCCNPVLVQSKVGFDSFGTSGIVQLLLEPESQALLDTIDSADSVNTTTVNLLDSALANETAAGPIWTKTAEAALYLAIANVSDTSLLSGEEQGEVLPLTGGGSLLVIGVNNTQSVILAFQGVSDTASPSAVNSSALYSPSNATALVVGNFVGAYSANLSSDPLISLINSSSSSTNLTEVVEAMMDGSPPLRVVMTGYRSGGALAQAAAIWAATTFPAAQIRCITFGVPQVGNQVFNWAFQELPDLSYTWSLASDTNYTNATAPTGNFTVPDQVRLLPSNSSTQGNNTLQDYLDAVAINAANGTVTPVLLPNPGNNISSFFHDIGALFDAASAVVQHSDYGNDQDSAMNNRNIAEAQQAISQAAGTCPVILCKARPASSQVCNVYLNGNNTIGPGSILISNNDTGANVALAWLPQNRTAQIVWRGTEGREDWAQDLRLSLTNATNISSWVARGWPSAEAHTGFYNQFRSVTLRAPSPQQNISWVLDQLSGGEVPNRVEVTGHSLGASVGTITAIWAASQWPAADVQSITFGSPKAGNPDLADAFQTLVGRQRRFINQLDIVPALPPQPVYTAVPYGIWIENNSTITLEDRPNGDSSDLTWNDHGCRQYEVLLYNNSHVWPPPKLNNTSS